MPKATTSISDRNLRPSTSSKSKESFINYNFRHFPNNLGHWVDLTKNMIISGMDFLARVGPIAWKAALKRKYLPTVIDKNMNICDEIDGLNCQYYEKIMGDTTAIIA